MSYHMNEIQKATQQAIVDGEKKRKRKFEESIDVIINLRNVNLKDPAKRFNNELELPNPVNPDPKICFFVDGDQLVEAAKLNADAMNKDKMEEMSKSDKATQRKFVKKYDFFIANSEMMKNVAKNFGKLFGPRGKMPRPQPQGYGVIGPGDSIAPSIERYKKIVRVKLVKDPVIQFKVGVKGMDTKKVAENVKMGIDFIEHKMEKGRAQIKSILIKTTMGPVVKIA